jgi:hypothetical protein
MQVLPAHPKSLEQEQSDEQNPPSVPALYGHLIKSLFFIK